MATVNPFDLLGDDENDDPSKLIAAKIASAPKNPAAAAEKLPSKPLLPSQAAREAARNNTRQVGPGRGRGGRGFGGGPNRGFGNEKVNGFAGGYGGDGGEFNRPQERDSGAYDGGRQSFRGGHRGGRHGGFVSGEAEGDSEPPFRRVYERRSGTSHGYETKRDGAGRGNWGTVADDAPKQETNYNVNNEDKIVVPDKQPEQELAPSTEVSKDNKEEPVNVVEKKEEDKEMTLEEYEKIREEKRKALLAMKTEERKVDVDKEFKSMQQLSLKKGNEDVFIKLGSNKDTGKKKETERDERAKKSVSINEFLKPAEGERYYGPGVGRGRGRGRGAGGSFRGGFGGRLERTAAAAPLIGDPGQFPTLGGK